MRVDSRWDEAGWIIRHAHGERNPLCVWVDDESMEFGEDLEWNGRNLLVKRIKKAKRIVIYPTRKLVVIYPPIKRIRRAETGHLTRKMMLDHLSEKAKIRCES
jgi:hypothetical protein